MANQITMPKLSDTMEEGTLVSWKKSVGDRVNKGDIIAEVETDKATMELEAFVSGTFLETRVKPGDVAPVGTVIAIIGEPGETVQEKPRREAEPPPEVEPAVPQQLAPPEAVTAKGEKEAPAPAETPARKEPAPEERAPEERAPKKEAPAPGEEKASPHVRRLARETGVDLATVKGTGPEGRILREDIEKTAGTAGKAEPVEAGPSPEEAETPAPAPGQVTPMSRMRAAIAKNVGASWRSIPHFTATVTVEMEKAEALRRDLKEAGVSVSVNDIVVKGVGATLRDFPKLNVSLSEEGVVHHPEVNIGIVVSLDEGLLVPVIRGCDRLSLSEIADSARHLIQKAKEGKITEREISGGTFTVSNMGMFGIDQFSAVIYPPQAAILAVSSILDLPHVRDGRLISARLMRMTVSADHRVVDGADAAIFLRELKRRLENPMVMLV
jgi:pyruvate dehydrogenase E2 component (dihydrolipoamide acetyltransferase)